MSETIAKNLSDVPATFLAPVYWRAVESQRPDAMIKDEKAVTLVKQMKVDAPIHLDLSRVKQIKMNELLQAMRIIFTREMGRYARDFINQHTDAVVVHIGCGLDSRFERVDNDRLEWYDLDLPEVIELRRKLFDDEGGRHHLLGCSVLDETWLEEVEAHSPRPTLFLAETVFVYFKDAQVKLLVLTLRDHFPGAELVFDGWRPFEIWVGNRYLSRSQFAGIMHWGFWRGQELEGWSDGIHLLGEWGFFDQPEPRLNPFRWMAPLFRLFKPSLPNYFELVKSRKSFWQKARGITPPTTLPERSWISRFLVHDNPEGKTLKGYGASTGKITARACVMRGSDDFNRMHPGDVIVAVTTTPAWTPLFAMASAVVTDIGGPLSHSSIVAREYGIPAVMATGVASKRIMNGQMITVDGGAGIVSLN